MRIEVQVGVSEGQRRLMLRRWKYADRVTLLMWASKVKVPSRMTPRLLTWGDGRTVELSMDMEVGVVLCSGGSVTNEEDLGFVTIQFEEVE